MSRIFIVFEVLSLLFSIYFFKGLKAQKLIWFIPLLVVVCITELLAINIKTLGLNQNHTIYNIYLVISTPLTFYIFLQMLGYRGFVKVISVITGALLFFFLLFNLLFFQGLYNVNTYSFILTELLISILALLVIARLFQQDDTGLMLNNHPYFWISASTLLFSVGTLILLGLQQFIQLHNVSIHGKSIYRIIIPVLDVIMYGCYCYAFYLCDKLRRNNRFAL